MLPVTYISARGAQFIRAWEGFRPVAYYDAGGVKTVGYGTTSSVISPLPDRVTVSQAEELFQRALVADVYPAMLEIGRWWVQAHFDAIASAVENLGSGILGPDHALGNALRSSKYESATPEALALYVHDGTAVLPGLVARRAAEAELWRTGTY